MDLQLSGKTAVVTGGSKGIGLAIVRTLLAEGMKVVTGSRSVEDGDWFASRKSLSQQPIRALRSSQTTVRPKLPVPSEIDVFVCEPDAVVVATLSPDGVPTRPVLQAPVMLLGEAAKATRRATSSGVLSRPVEAPRLFLS